MKYLHLSIGKWCKQPRHSSIQLSTTRKLPASPPPQKKNASWGTTGLGPNYIEFCKTGPFGSYGLAMT